MPSFLERRILAPLAAQLKQGQSPEKLAQSAAFGAVIACCPLFGATTAIGVGAGVVFRLNHPTLQLVNYLFAPVQLALMIPFFRAGDRLFGHAPAPLRPDAVLHLFRSDLFAAARTYGGVALRGAVAWLLIAPIAILFLSKILEPLLRRMKPA